MPCLAFPWSLSSARSRRNASRRTSFLISSFHSCRICFMSCVSSKELPVHLMPVHPFFACLRLFPRSITLVSPSDLSKCPYHFRFRRFAVARRSPIHYNIWCMVVIRRCSLVIRSPWRCQGSRGSISTLAIGFSSVVLL